MLLVLKTLLSQEFDMKDLGAAKKILGMWRFKGIETQRNCGYLDRFGMNSAKPVSTTLANHFKLSSNQCLKTDKEVADMAEVTYVSVVGCLMYAIVCTCPGLTHGVS